MTNKINKVVFGILFISLYTTAFAQVGVGTASPDASAALEVASTTKGLLPPRMTNAQMNVISSPATGLLLYCTDCFPAGLYVYNGTAYISISSEVTPISNTGTGSTLAIVGANGEAFSSNTTCSGKVISATACSTTELNNGIGSDPDGGGYTVVEIGDATSGYKQCWMAENMQDGNGPTNAWLSSVDTGWYGYMGDVDQIPDTPPTTDGNGTTGSALAYNEKEGFIYQWSAAMNGATAERSQGICPTGWHIPSDCEWMFLENNLGMSVVQQEVNETWRGTDEGTQLKEGGSSNFEATLTGYRHYTATFYNRGEYTAFWTSTRSGNEAVRYGLLSSDLRVQYGLAAQSIVFSVRCLKD